MHRIAPTAFAAVMFCTAFPALAQEPDDGDWPMAARDYASTRYSPLDQLTTDNVAGLQVQFTFPPA